MKKSYFKIKPRKPMKRTHIRVKGCSTTTEQKDEIQALLRFIACYRDGGCVLRNLRHCGNEAIVAISNNETGDIYREIISNKTIQYDHLITRANSATFANSELGVCICNPCHAWKKWNEDEYNELVKTTLSKKRIKLWEECEKYRKQHKTFKPDWKLAIISLQMELKQYEN